jgi:hypothetical protein
MLFRLGGPDPQRPTRRCEFLVEAADEASAREEIAALGVDTSAWTIMRETPKVKLLKGQEVSLGCGTLIAIALIVLFFSRTRTGDLEHEVRVMQSEVGELKKAVEAQTGEIKALRDQLDKSKPKD